MERAAGKVYDVVVAGGGVMGIWAAIAARRAGASVALLEQVRSCVRRRAVPR